MDQDTLVTEQVESGRRLIEGLPAQGFEIQVAFWAKLSDEGKWYLYLASPYVDENGPLAAYRLVLPVVRAMPDLWIDPMEIRVVGLRDSIAAGALEATKPKVSPGRFAVANPKPYSGFTWFRGPSLGGASIDGAGIYAPVQPMVQT